MWCVQCPWSFGTRLQICLLGVLCVRHPWPLAACAKVCAPCASCGAVWCVVHFVTVSFQCGRLCVPPLSLIFLGFLLSVPWPLAPFGWASFPFLALRPRVVRRCGLWCPVSLLCPYPLLPRLWPCMIWVPRVLGLDGSIPCCPPALPSSRPVPGVPVPVPAVLDLGGLFLCCAPPPGPEFLVVFSSGCPGPLRRGGRFPCCSSPPLLRAALCWVAGPLSCFVAHCCCASWCVIFVVPFCLGLFCAVLLVLLRHCAVLLTLCGFVVCAFCAGGAQPPRLLCSILLLVVSCHSVFCAVCFAEFGILAHWLTTVTQRDDPMNSSKTPRNVLYVKNGHHQRLNIS